MNRSIQIIVLFDKNRRYRFYWYNIPRTYAVVTMFDFFFYIKDLKIDAESENDVISWVGNNNFFSWFLCCNRITISLLAENLHQIAFDWSVAVVIDIQGNGRKLGGNWLHATSVEPGSYHTHTIILNSTDNYSLPLWTLIKVKYCQQFTGKTQ